MSKHCASADPTVFYIDESGQVLDSIHYFLLAL